MRALPCPICSSTATALRYSQFENPWWLCGACGLRFREPREAEPYESGACFTRASFYHGRNFLADHRRALAEFLPFLRRGRFLDVGFGAGGYLLAAREQGFDAFGLDTSERNVNEVSARYRLPVRRAALEQAKLETAGFDTALLAHVIEHLPDPVATLRELARVLVRGGTLVLITPNAACYLEALVRHRWPMYRPTDHIRLFTPASLRRALQAAGFQVARLWTTDSPADFPLGLASALRGAAGIRGTADLLADQDAAALPLWRRLAYKTLPLFGYPFLLMRYGGIASCLKCVATRP